MIRLLLVRLLLTVVALGCCVGIVWELIDDSLIYRLPFRLEPHGQERVVRPRASVALPAPLRDGEILDIRRMSVVERAALFSQETYSTGSSITLLVRRNDKLERMAVLLPPAPRVARNAGDSLQAWAQVTPLLALLAVALMTLWRGRDATAAWMCAFAVSLLYDNGVGPLEASPIVSLLLQLLQQLVEAVLGGAVYGMAASASRAGLPAAWRRACLLIVVLLVSVAGIDSLLSTILLVCMGITVPEWASSVSMFLVAGPLVISVLTLLVGYAHAPPESRARMRWILVSTALLMASALGNLLFLHLHNSVMYVVSNVALGGLALFGYLYAILRTRIVDVTFVIDRALVYSVITAFVFGLFSLLEDAVHHLALGEQLSWIVQAGGALVVAAAMSPLHRLLDRGLERVFFHKLRAMAATLRTLGKESAFFENEEALMARVLKQLRVPCAAAAIYERSGAVYVLRVADGAGWPGAVDADDPLFVTLRAGRHVLDLKGRDSAAGADGLAFPMAIGQILTGAVVARLREGEQLDSEVRGALAELAQALGTSLYLLRYRELAELAAEISSGNLDPEAARLRAAALAGAP